MVMLTISGNKMTEDKLLTHIVKIIAKIVFQVSLTGVDKKLFIIFRKPVDWVSFFAPDNSQGCWVMFCPHFIF